EGVPARVAPEAVEEVELRVNGEGGRLFLMEGTEPLPALARPLEGHHRPHEVHEIHRPPGLVQGLGGPPHRPALRPGIARGPRPPARPSAAAAPSSGPTVAP